MLPDYSASKFAVRGLTQAAGKSPTHLNPTEINYFQLWSLENTVLRSMQFVTCALEPVHFLTLS